MEFLRKLKVCVCVYFKIIHRRNTCNHIITSCENSQIKELANGLQVETQIASIWYVLCTNRSFSNFPESFEMHATQAF